MAIRMETALPPRIYRSREAEFFRRRHNSTLCFVLALLLFLLPFAEFRCGDIAILTNTGIGIATGGSWEVSRSWKSYDFAGQFIKGRKREQELMKDGPNSFALAAILAGVFGIGIAFVPVNWRSMAGMCAGILGALMLIALMIQFRTDTRSMLGKEAKNEVQAGLNLENMLRLRFTIWYYSSLVLFLMAAFLNYMRDKIALREAMAAAVDFEFQK